MPEYETGRRDASGTAGRMPALQGMNETCQNAEKFLSELVDDLRFDLKVSSRETQEGCVLNLSGNDSGLALSENAELLDAFEVILFQIFGRELDRSQRIICDGEGFRQTRKS